MDIVLGLLVALTQLAGPPAPSGGIGLDQVQHHAPSDTTAVDQVKKRGALDIVPSGAAAKATSTAASTLGNNQQIPTQAPDLLGNDQITDRTRTADAPPPLSTLREGRVVSVVVVHGHDRCDPVSGDATRQECASIPDNRADQFVHASGELLDPTPEQAVIGSPAASDLARDATASRRLSRAEGASPDVAAAFAAEVGSAGAAQAGSPVNLPTALNPATPSAAAAAGGVTTIGSPRWP